MIMSLKMRTLIKVFQLRKEYHRTTKQCFSGLNIINYRVINYCRCSDPKPIEKINVGALLFKRDILTVIREKSIKRIDPLTKTSTKLNPIHKKFAMVPRSFLQHMFT